LVEKETCPACGGPMQGSICPACLSQQKASAPGPDEDYDNSDDYISDLNLAAPATTEDDFDPFTQIAAQTSLPERLINKLQPMLSDAEMVIATYLVGNLNDNGYLQMSVEEVAHQIDVPVEAVELVLAILQSLEPIGIGARDLRECLLIQLQYL